MRRIIWNKIYFDKLDSTNLKAKDLAKDADEGTVIIANEQLSGKGRLGRNWVSLKDKGIYMSMILKPDILLEDVSKITLIGAAAVNQAIAGIGVRSEIKWPNDIVIDGKKVCGILTEMNYSSSRINFLVMGIGVNANLDMVDLPNELIHKTTSLKIVTGLEIDKEVLINLVLEEFETLYKDFINKNNLERTIEICKRHSAILGKEVKIINVDNVRVGKAIDINKNGELIVKFDTGIESIISGEISVRGLNGYI